MAPNRSTPKKATNGTKRKADDQTSPAQSERPQKDQKTLEETLKPTEGVDDEGFDEEMRDDEPDHAPTTESKSEEQQIEEEVNAGDQVEEPLEQTKNEESKAQQEKNGDKSAVDEVKADETDEGTMSVKVGFSFHEMICSRLIARALTICAGHYQ